MNEKEKEKITELKLPKTFTEFYPKNYKRKSNPQPKEKENPIKEKENLPQKPKEVTYYYPKYRKLKNKFNNINPPTKKYDYDNNEDYSDDDYSGLASKNNNKNDQIYNNNNNNKKKFIKFSDDHNDFKTKYKTEICHYWEMYGKCKYGDSCAFAHGNDELNKRKMSSNYKTKLCKQFFELGYCAYGKRCQFSHKKIKDNEEEEDKVSYMKILNEFNGNNNLISHEIIKRPRLITFEDITKSGKDLKEKNRLALYEDILEIKKKENEEPDKVFSEDTNDGNSISNELNNLINDDTEENFDFDFNIDDYTYNNNNENKEKKRERFISA